MGYAMFPLAEGGAGALETRSCAEPPSIENDYYRLTFGANGWITGIVDKQLDRQLIDAAAPYGCNQFVFTRDAHESFSSPAESAVRIEPALDNRDRSAGRSRERATVGTRPLPHAKHRRKQPIGTVRVWPARTVGAVRLRCLPFDVPGACSASD